MKVCKIWDADYPWDVRVEKICHSFIKCGHEVHLVCRNKKKRNIYEYEKGLHIHRLPKIYALFGGIFSFPFFLNPIWLFAILKVVKKYKVDLIIVRDLPLALAGVIVGKLSNTPCYLDMAEPYPEMLDGYKKIQKVSLKKKAVNMIVRNSYLANAVEKLACRYLTHIFPVSNEMKNNLICKGVNASKITVLHNTPIIKYDTYNNNMKEDVEKDKIHINIIYVGDLTEARGLPIVIDAVDKMKRMEERFKFVIIGSGRYESDLKKIVNEKELDNEVMFTGWIPYEKIPNYFVMGDIGIIPHLKTMHNDLTMPNKVFDYMAASLPIVSANLVPIRRIIVETNAGIIFEDYTVDALVKALMRLKDKETRKRLAENGRHAVENIYNWDHDFNILVNTISNDIRK